MVTTPKNFQLIEILTMAKKKRQSKQFTSTAEVRKAVQTVSGIQKQKKQMEEAKLNRKQRREMAKLNKKIGKDYEAIMKTYEEYYATNKSWDDLKNLYNANAQMLANNFSQLISLYKTPQMLDFLEKEDFKEIKIMFGGIQRDFEQMTNRLVSIADKHSNNNNGTREFLAGGVTNEEEFNNSLLIFEEYQDFTEKYSAIITPTYNTLMEKAGVALGKVKEATDSVIKESIAEQASSLENNSPIDVPFKEVTND